MTLIILNLKNNERFEKHFDSPYLAEQFKRKLKYSKKLRLVGELYV